MKTVLTISKWLVALLLVATLFMWGIAHGSGHKIPASTDRALGGISAAFTTLLLIITVYRKKLK